MSNSNVSSNTSAIVVPWKSVILEIFFIESTSEFQTSVTFLLVNENIRWVVIFSVRS